MCTMAKRGIATTTWYKAMNATTLIPLIPKMFLHLARRPLLKDSAPDTPSLHLNKQVLNKQVHETSQLRTLLLDGVALSLASSLSLPLRFATFLSYISFLPVNLNQFSPRSLPIDTMSPSASVSVAL